MTDRNSIGASAEHSQHLNVPASQAGSRDAQCRKEEVEQQPGQNGAAIVSENEEPERPTEDDGSIEPVSPNQARAAAASGPRTSKTEATLKLLRRKNGAALSELQEATGWQAHSVRGFLSGTVKKKLGLSLSSEVGRQGVRRYRITTAAAAD